MAEAPAPATTGLAARSKRDGALDEALERLAPGRPSERPDTPDLHVTAVRRLPVSLPMTVTVTPGSTAPDSSFTTPEIVPLVWA